MKVTYHVFKDFRMEVSSSSDEEVLSLLRGRNRAAARTRMYSYVSMCYHPARKKLFLGCTHRAGDIMVEFDPRTRKFKSCGFARSGLFNPHITKIHKGITLDEKGEALYFGTASLSPLSQTIESKGGLLVRYDIRKRKFTKIANPAPGDYFQGTCFDLKRGMAYAFTDRAAFVVYDMRKKKTVRYESMESCPHSGVIDDRGGVWGTYGAGRHAFYRYNPKNNRFEFPRNCAFHNASAAAGIMYPGAGPVDSIVNGRDGYLYAGSALGEVYRIDPRSGEVKYLGKPFPGQRMPGMTLAEDGWIYMCGAKDFGTLLARYSPAEDRFERFGQVKADDGEFLYYGHELAVIDGTVFIGETDNKNRTGYLWACQI